MQIALGFAGGYAPCGLSPQIDGMPVILKTDAFPQENVRSMIDVLTFFAEVRQPKSRGRLILSSLPYGYHDEDHHGNYIWDYEVDLSRNELHRQPQVKEIESSEKEGSPYGLCRAPETEDHRLQ